MSAEEKVNDVEISCEGIDLLVNNDWDGCEKLYAKYKDHSPLLNYCNSFVCFTRAVMTFEEPLLEKAQKEIEATEKLCAANVGKKGGLSSFKKAFGISSSSSSQSIKTSDTNNNTGQSMANDSLEDKLTKAIILADCKLYLAMLTFIRQEVSAYLSNGILQIRKSWKMYAKIQKQLYDIYKKLEPNAEQIYGSDPNSNVIQLLIEENDASSSAGSNSGGGDLKPTESEAQFNQALNELNISEEGADLGLDTCKRLLGAVSFGYGLFQICISFIPSNVLKLVKLFGFEGDRNVAIKAINFTSNSRDMRAPFADIVLLWYATIATPLFGITEADGLIALEDTKSILDKNLAKYDKSSLFLYLKGKYSRTLLHDSNASYECFQLSSEYSKHIREIQFISIYEIGWLHLERLDYANAFNQFQVLHNESKWSKSFNTYICAILQGALGQFNQANKFVKEALKIINAQSRKPNPIELFALKRIEYFKKNAIQTKAICEMLVIEMLYLWVCFPYCNEEHLRKMLETLDQIADKQFVPLKCLLEGSIHLSLNNKEFGEQCFNESIARGENMKSQSFGKYVQPCAHYELATIYTNAKDYSNAKSYMIKSRDNYKDYELDNRIQAKIKSLQKRIKFEQDGPKMAALLKERAQAEVDQKNIKEKNANNFFIN